MADSSADACSSSSDTKKRVGPLPPPAGGAQPWYRAFPKWSECNRPELVGCVHLCALPTAAHYQAFRRAAHANRHEILSPPSSSASAQVPVKDADGKRQVDPSHLEEGDEADHEQLPVYFVDVGRYQTGVGRCFRDRGWIRLVPCPAASIRMPPVPSPLVQAVGAAGTRTATIVAAQRSSASTSIVPSLDLLARVAGFVWLKNRGRFPVRTLSRSHALCNHLPDEWELTKKDRLAANLHSFRVALHGHSSAGQSLPLSPTLTRRTSVESTDTSTAGGSKVASTTEESRDASTAAGSKDASTAAAAESKNSSTSESPAYPGLLRLPIHPETYNLREWSQCMLFVEPLLAARDRRQGGRPVDGTLWILKPSKGSGGSGIRLLSEQDLHDLISEYEALKQRYPRAVPPRPPGDPDDRYCMTSKIVQRYLARPMLVERRKFDIRAYLFVASVGQQLVFYHDGYIRINAEEYDSDLSDLSNNFSHLSNITIQKKHPRFVELQDSMRWELPKFQQYLTEHSLAGPTFVEDVLKPQMKAQLWHAFRAASGRIEQRPNFFMFVGADFLLEESGRVWLLEFSKSPACFRSPGAQHLTDNWNYLIQNTAALAQEVYERSTVGDPPTPQTVHTLSQLGSYEVCLPLSEYRAYSAYRWSPEQTATAVINNISDLVEQTPHTLEIKSEG
eukprot:CAMPEP_0177660364 /NCGR_PEP_ID=MMETSP0447-20121125/17996_1 /TAXON_ID=0 /ORGANISM="Stygamoeba regulata, Strain BSH-02190019" /LENGTH=675 /DNA_ID=CAMNT_0019165415 /DNA_START=110 /DNA_END=2137 /DNA_ORIENTATION=+